MRWSVSAAATAPWEFVLRPLLLLRSGIAFHYVVVGKRENQPRTKAGGGRAGGAAAAVLFVDTCKASW